MNELEERLVEICIDQGENLLNEFGEFYPFAFGIKQDGSINSISTYFEKEFPEIQEFISHLEKTINVSHHASHYKGVVLCTNVITTPPYSNEKLDALSIRIDLLNAVKCYFLPYVFLNSKVDFLDLYCTEEGEKILKEN